MQTPTKIGQLKRRRGGPSKTRDDEIEIIVSKKPKRRQMTE